MCNNPTLKLRCPCLARNPTASPLLIDSLVRPRSVGCPSRQEDLENRLKKKIRESSALEKARADHASITDSDPIDKVCE